MSPPRSKNTRSQVRALHDFARSLPEAWEDHPWDEVVFKVRKKVFVFLGKAAETADKVHFSVKLPHTGPELIDQEIGQPTGYGLGKSGWVTVSFEPGEEVAVDEMCDWIEESYRAIAPKTLSRQLDATS